MNALRHTSATLIAIVGAMTLTTAQSDLTLSVAGRPNSTPWIAAAGSTVAVAWTVATDGRAGDAVVAMSTDGGASFGAPVRVNAVPGEVRINSELAPRVALLPRRSGPPVVTVTWNARAGATSSVKTARSTDGGRTFAAPASQQDEGAPGDRGWQATAFDAKGTLHTIWLDHRAMASAPMHKGEHDGVAMAQRSGLYYRVEGGAERELLKGVCFCCKTAFAIGPGGELYAAWRHVFAGNMRDMGFTMSRDGGRTFSPLTRVNEDGWSINGCPDDGPAMAVDARGSVHLVWPTVQHEQGVILYSTTRNGTTFSTPARMPNLGGRRPSHPHVAVDATGRVMVAWDESKDGVRSAAIAPADGSRAPLVLGPNTSYPVLAATANGVIAAWTSGPPASSVIAVRRIN